MVTVPEVIAVIVTGQLPLTRLAMLELNVTEPVLD
jgi:hypothetical protein